MLFSLSHLFISFHHSLSSHKFVNPVNKFVDPIEFDSFYHQTKDTKINQSDFSTKNKKWYVKSSKFFSQPLSLPHSMYLKGFLFLPWFVNYNYIFNMLAYSTPCKFYGITIYNFW